MKRKFVTRMIFIAIIASLSVTSLVGCGTKLNKVEGKSLENFNDTGYPVVNEPIDLSIFAYTEPGSKDWNTFDVFKSINEQTGVNAKFDCVAGTAATEKKNLILASNDLPDLFMSGVNTSDLEKYSKQGSFIPLNDLIDKYAPNVKALLEKNPEIEKAITMPDGKIYALPSIYENQGDNIPTYLFLNKTWLDKLGLQVPKTTDEFYEVLKAFKTQDPNGNGKNDEVPFTYTPNNIWNGDTSLSGAFGVIDNEDHVMVKEGKLVYTLAEEGYKEYIKWTNKLYSEGLIDQEIFTQDHSQYMAKRGSDYVGAYLTHGPADTPGIEWVAIEPLKGPNGDQLWGRFQHNIDKNRAVITSSNENPEATMRWLDEFYKKENSLKLRWGSLIEKDGEKWILKEREKGYQDDCPGPYAPGAVTEETLRNELELNSGMKTLQKNFDLYDKYAIKEPLPLLTFTSDEINEITIIKTDIGNYVKEMKAKWTTGERDVEKDWAEYKDRLNKMGLEKYMEIYQKAYDRYNSN